MNNFYPQHVQADLQSGNDNGITNADTQGDGISNPVEQWGRGAYPQPLPRGRGVYILSLVQAPSLWERLRVGELCSGMGWGGLHFNNIKNTNKQ